MKTYTHDDTAVHMGRLRGEAELLGGLVERVIPPAGVIRVNLSVPDDTPPSAVQAAFDAAEGCTEQEYKDWLATQRPEGAGLAQAKEQALADIQNGLQICNGYDANYPLDNSPEEVRFHVYQLNTVIAGLLVHQRKIIKVLAEHLGIP